MFLGGTLKQLLKLKEWLTVDDTARYLSLTFEEGVSRADVLRLALDGHLLLSVNLVNHAYARKGKKIPLEEANTSIVPSPFDDTVKIQLLDGILIDRENEIVLKLDDNVTSLEGVWDLPMIGNERLDVEHEYQQLTGGAGNNAQ